MNIDGRQQRGFGRIGSMKYQDLTESYGCSEGFFPPRFVRGVQRRLKKLNRGEEQSPQGSATDPESGGSSVDIHREMRKWNFVEGARGNTATDRQWGGIRKFCQTQG